MLSSLGKTFAMIIDIIDIMDIFGEYLLRLISADNLCLTVRKRN